MLDVTDGDLFIDGRSAPGDRRFEVRDPGRTSDLVATITEGTPGDVDLAVTAAARAGAGWARIPLETRLKVLADAVDRVDSQTDGLARLLTRENGGTIFESTMDITRGTALFRDFFARGVRVLEGHTTDDEQQWLRIERRPVGVTALIVPWNSPIVLTLSKLAPALIAGNTVVVKPSVLAPTALGRVLRTIAELLPAGVVNVVHGDVEVGNALVTHPAVRMVSFTGSVAVGKQIMAAAAGNVKRVGLELGGNDPALILDDVDPASAAPLLAKGMFARAGQVCFAVKRVYVPRSRHDEIVEAVAAEVSQYKVGHGLDTATTFGPLISAQAKARVTGLAQRAADAGGDVREFGCATDSVDWDGGHYLLPRIVTGLAPSAELVEVEQFGPLVPFIAYDDVDQAVAMANDSKFGLCSSVWGTDTDRAIAVAREIESGGTFINGHNVSSLSFDMPFGGFKQSGLGRERTDIGLLEYVEEHAIRMTR